MSWILKDAEIENVLRLDGPMRLQYCIKRVADQQVIWSLRQDDGWAVVADQDGREMVPVWPHEHFARMCATGSWSAYRAEAIDVDVWLERWTPGMERDSRLVAVFMTPEDKGVALTPRSFETELRAELENYE